MRALLESASHLCEAVVLTLGAVPLGTVLDFGVLRFYIFAVSTHRLIPRAAKQGKAAGVEQVRVPFEPFGHWSHFHWVKLYSPHSPQHPSTFPDTLTGNMPHPTRHTDGFLATLTPCIATLVQTGRGSGSRTASGAL